MANAVSLVNLAKTETKSVAVEVLLGDLQENKIPSFEREGWQSQPSLSKLGILLIRRSLAGGHRYTVALAPDEPLLHSLLALFLARFRGHSDNILL